MAGGKGPQSMSGADIDRLIFRIQRGSGWISAFAFCSAGFYVFFHWARYERNLTSSFFGRTALYKEDRFLTHEPLSRAEIARRTAADREAKDSFF